MKQFVVALRITLLLLASIRFSWAQQPAITPAPTPAAVDSTQIDTDSIPVPAGQVIRVGQSELISDSSALVRPDTARLTAKQEAQIRRIVPRVATLRSLMLPGLGQAYNRQYYKIPFIYAGFGVMGYLFVRYRGLAREAAEGYRLLLFGNMIRPEQRATLSPTQVPGILINPAEVKIPAVYDKPEQVIIGEGVFRSAANAKNAYDTYRRYRDLNVILSIALYALNAVEANVSAHLKTFDLSDDISMRVEPSILPMPSTGLVPGVRVALTFK
ncbi:DUF5683 domain-containing protein [Spirosoma montaniterrae]|uniref:DUF5683 domain-containing protein n=1 Tax=Spirosoma montaniterrae TaxID=1178516 RepID=A0A1P9WXJ1_9BACT|nr:DUF5683 domain-containing protein [Spirosoma montaniterrae]AQG80095.1 hypothetical protein AWR27_12620 [Spirosoma montaniterrae]